MRALLLINCVLCVALVGCSQSSVNSKGKVLFEDGQPVQSGSIEFRSINSGQRYTSRIDRQGNFELRDEQNRAAIVPGEYDVVVVQIVLTEDLPLEMHTHGQTVHRRYADYHTSGLTTRVQADQAEPIKVVVKAQ